MPTLSSLRDDLVSPAKGRNGARIRMVTFVYRFNSLYLIGSCNLKSHHDECGKAERSNHHSCALSGWRVFGRRINSVNNREIIMKALELVRAFSAMAAGLFARHPVNSDRVIQKVKSTDKAKPSRKTFSIVQSNGDGTALCQCRQTGEYEVRKLERKDNMSSEGIEWFFNRA